MTALSSKIVVIPAALLGLSLTLASCGNKPQAPATAPAPTALPHAVVACDEMKTNSLAAISITAPPDAQARIRSLLGEAHRLITASVAIETELMEACRVIGRGAGAFDEELKGVPDGGKGAEKVCAIAAAKAEKILNDAKADKIELVVEFDKPLCFTDVGTIKQCLVDCGQQVTGDDRASCTGGELYGTCKGRCSAACANDPGTGVGSCWGVCNGKCDKEFRGTCGGKCTGTCNGKKLAGPHRCVGICDGSCSDKSEGVCGGKCDGACSGPWEPRDLGKCNGICTGQCVGQAGQPVCSGEYVPPGVDPTCLATCTSTAAVGVRCDAPLMHVTVKNGQNKQTPELQKLLTGLQAGLPRLMRVTDGTSKKMPRAIEGISAAAIEWSNAYATSGAKALSCVRTGLDSMKAGADAIDIAVKGAGAFKPLLTPLIKPPDAPRPAPEP
ncbi:keratin associated protein [Minicystis rosea]|nr:keratin associated protein [Minicystis rosea]